MDGKKIAAIGITLVIALTILIGYASNLETVERSGWETDSTANITDRILNNNEPYYIRSYSASNNAELFAVVNFGGGVIENRILAPAYQSQGGTYSSLPIYTTASASYTLNSYTNNTTSGHTYSSYATAVSYNNEIPANAGYYYFTTTTLAQFYGGGYSPLGTAFGPFLQTGTGAWVGLDQFGTDVPMNTSTQIVSDQMPTYTIISRPWTQLNINSDYATNFSGDCAIKLVDNYGNTTYYQSRPTNQTYIAKTGSTVILNNHDTYSNIASVYIAPGVSTGNSITYYYTAATGDYGNPAYGWTIPTVGGMISIEPSWINGQSNNLVRMMIDIESGESTSLRAKSSDGTYSSWMTISHVSSDITVAGNTLGNYRYVCCDIGRSSMTVYGISSWPPMAADPDLLNSVTVDYGSTLTDISMIDLSGLNTVNYRVDYADMKVGTYPNTVNAQLDLAAYYPGKSCAMSFTSIGVYGDSITFGGQTFQVTNNSITVDGKTAPLLKSMFTITYNDDTNDWTNSINNIPVSTGSPSTIRFNGTWSTTIAGHAVVPMTGTTLEWQPGGFGIDIDQFGLIGAAMCAVLFVALGIYGRRSENKLLWLALVFGGLTLIFLIII